MRLATGYGLQLKRKKFMQMETLVGLQLPESGKQTLDLTLTSATCKTETNVSEAILSSLALIHSLSHQ